MPWVTSSGARIEFPHDLWAKIANSSRIRREDVLDAFKESQRIHMEAVNLSAKVAELESQVVRLTHENEFMVKLVNGRDLPKDALTDREIADLIPDPWPNPEWPPFEIGRWIARAVERRHGIKLPTQPEMM